MGDFSLNLWERMIPISYPFLSHALGHFGFWYSSGLCVTFLSIFMMVGWLIKPCSFVLKWSPFLVNKLVRISCPNLPFHGHFQLWFFMWAMCINFLPLASLIHMFVGRPPCCILMVKTFIKMRHIRLPMVNPWMGPHVLQSGLCALSNPLRWGIWVALGGPFPFYSSLVHAYV